MIGLGILEQYRNAPKISTHALPSYHALRGTIDRDYMHVLSQGIIVLFVDCQPYRDETEMFKDLDRHVLKVSTQFNNHPFFTPEENLRFRVIHDYHHYKSQNGFDLMGEYRTYLEHALTLPLEAIPALFSEVVIQAAYFTEYGEFPEQKVWTMEG